MATGMSLVLAMLGLPFGVSWEVGAVNSALATVLLALTGTTLAMVALIRFLPSGSFGKWLVLDTTLGETAAEDPQAQDWTAPPDEWGRFMGCVGEALTDLRPAGKARLDGEVVDVVSAHSWVHRGERVKVIQVEGVRVVVEPHRG